ncbi:MAG: 6-phosphogluconolactonase [Ruthenibacterium lactatiformans]
MPTAPQWARRPREGRGCFCCAVAGAAGHRARRICRRSSQNEFLEAPCAAPDIDWKRVTAFHMDEYVGLDAAAPQGFGNFLRARVFDRLPFGQVCYLNGNAPDIEAECSRYAGLLAQAPIDIVFMGIGENGHIAFNDPPVAEFDDPAAVKVVALDEVCRNQQVHDGCFADIGQVPTHALTLTVPTLAGAKHHLCIVPAPTKAKAVRDTLEGPSPPRARHPSFAPAQCGALSGARERPASDGGIRS